MPRKYADRRRRAFVVALQESDAHWGALFGDEVFYDLNYSDLFTRMWLARDRAFTKTELYGFMPKVSHRTAVKYVQTAIERGLLSECIDSEDRRRRRITMAPALIKTIEDFLDASLQTFEARAVFR
ncbi:MarR family transcriptional regulator [Alloalcanivorax mobilis]|uniref:MarR family transcriptional regulator n=1 Tax=Alloalcanivorax mobilis TaxID=2019569 RepID=UPI001E3854F0|nr:MarR family transcriptional regulator [Alloalcanivorax mobilis]|tara:strand:- start:41966 stop:42343 length:378 start_codon:yes stop_codon:yes gene_type:complete